MLVLTIFLTSLLVVAFSIPPIINLAFKKRLFDEPSEERKVHKRIVPNFGGVAIFTGFVFTSCLFISHELLPQASILMAAGLILFTIGLKDDMIGLSPLVKFVAQFTNAIIVAVVADIRIESLQGIMGFGQLDYYVSVALTVIFIVGVVNAFNLIDGVDCLAASLGVMVSVIFACLFFEANELGWAYLSICLCGALIGFLIFNVTPAKIFMGDSGSLVLGFIAVTLGVKYIQLADVRELHFSMLPITSTFGLVASILLIPIFDTLRVFTLRIVKGRSPFEADSNHLHHRLLFLGFSHLQVTLILVLTNTVFVVMTLLCQSIGNGQLLSLLILTSLSANGLLTLYIERYKASLIKVRPEPTEDKRAFADQILESINKN